MIVDLRFVYNESDVSEFVSISNTNNVLTAMKLQMCVRGPLVARRFEFVLPESWFFWRNSNSREPIFWHVRFGFSVKALAFTRF